MGNLTNIKHEKISTKTLYSWWCKIYNYNSKQPIYKIKHIILNQLFFQFKFLSKSLPNNINILSFEKWDGKNSFLLRIEHLLEKDEELQQSKDVEINLNVSYLIFRQIF